MRFPEWTFNKYIFYWNVRIPKDISRKPIAERTFLELVFPNFFSVFHNFLKFFHHFFHFFHDFFFGFSRVKIFSDISERNNDYSDTLDFRRGWVGEVGLVTFFVLKVPDYESAMLIYFYIYMYKKLRYRSQFWSDFHEIHMVGAGLLTGEPYRFWKQSAQ